jgi:hypothetical protein
VPGYANGITARAVTGSKEFYIIMRMSDGVERVSLESESIGLKASMALAKEGNEFEIHSVFGHAVYISAGRNGLIKLIRNNDFINERSILIKQDGTSPVSFSCFGKGARVSYYGKMLTAGGGSIRIDLSRARIYKKESPPEKKAVLGTDDVAFNLRLLRDVIYTHPGREGLVPLLENVELRGPMKVFLEPGGEGAAERARPHIERLMWGLYAGDVAAVTDNAGRILGLGSGLTPSCDDFIAGLLMSVNFAGMAFSGNGRDHARFFKKTGDQIVKLAKEKTTVYSLGLIGDASNGEGPLAALNLIRSLVAGSPEDTVSSAKKLIGMGAATGADIAVGIYYGVRFLASIPETEALSEIA